jgi:uncharacterized membrane protein (DUF4010 family)
MSAVTPMPRRLPWAPVDERREEAVIPEATQLLIPTFVALCLGALVGLERQVAQEEREREKDFPGVRTFAFTALVGALAVLLTRELGPWIGIALFVAFAAFLVFRYHYDTAKRGDPGYTTEIASLCTFAVGALAQSGNLLVATVVTIVMVALLRSKRALHRAGELLEPTDMEVLIRFLVITGIVLPLLPDQPIDPFFGVLRPRDVWRMVVLISAVSFAGYVLMRVRPQSPNAVITGVLGGLVSSTATAIAYARAAADLRGARSYEALVVVAASTTFLRMAIELAVVNRTLLVHVAAPLAILLLAGFAMARLFHRPDVESKEVPSYENPLNLRVALTFAALYAAVLLMVAGAREVFADAGLFALSALAAVAGADAPTLSLARLTADGAIPPEVAARGVVLVAAATTLSKVGILLAVSRGPFVRRVIVTLLAISALGAALFVWML